VLLAAPMHFGRLMVLQMRRSEWKMSKKRWLFGMSMVYSLYSLVVPRCMCSVRVEKAPAARRDHIPCLLSRDAVCSCTPAVLPACMLPTDHAQDDKKRLVKKCEGKFLPCRLVFTRFERCPWPSRPPRTAQVPQALRRIARARRRERPPMVSGRQERARPSLNSDVSTCWRAG
jgi:hypothetical protein